MTVLALHTDTARIPFGGCKASGYGRGQGAEALENDAQYKTIWANLG